MKIDTSKSNIDRIAVLLSHLGLNNIYEVDGFIKDKHGYTLAVSKSVVDKHLNYCKSRKCNECVYHLLTRYEDDIDCRTLFIIETLRDLL